MKGFSCHIDFSGCELPIQVDNFNTAVQENQFLNKCTRTLYLKPILYNSIVMHSIDGHFLHTGKHGTIFVTAKTFKVNVILSYFHLLQ